MPEQDALSSRYQEFSARLQGPLKMRTQEVAVLTEYFELSIANHGLTNLNEIVAILDDLLDGPLSQAVLEKFIQEADQMLILHKINFVFYVKCLIADALLSRERLDQ